ncbi:far upstream element-binding protein 1-like isoform X2 [Acanthaster planci]|uniref:Far upstream element-binding protein 1-like isoform X2 n=1 Tax=Acanthaster planci TaxID=133434 RepID=A0A8B7YR90_ACAPL|nr:far upstream element-binding protein 1-like isoform X2 [Acanthaster planci]
MTDFQAVAPPASISNDGKSAFADAVQRAKQIAAKIGGSTLPAGQAGDPSVSLGLKRPLDELSGEEPAGKKNMAFPNMSDPLGSNMYSMKPGMPGIGSATENYKVPANLVGLIIGKGGETINKIQEASDCKVQVAGQNDIDNPDVRTCTLMGTPEAVQRAKQELDNIIYNSKEAVTEQLMIKANKVGLVIGKKGETIRKLMEQSGARMMMIQDSTANTGMEKPLKITGDPSQVERAKELISELLDKQQQEYNNSVGGGGQGAPRGQSNYGGGDNREFTVPRQTVGIIIGKKGEMIRSIQEDTGARVQFKEDDGCEERVCIITGPTPAVDRAQEIVDEIVQEAKQRDMERGMGMRGRGRGRGGGPNNFGNRGGFMGGRPGMMRDNQYRNGGEMREIPVAANKCGLIIGRGGANIQAITARSGARVEMTPRVNQMGEKIFTIQGTSEQISSAEQLIQEKLNQGPMGGGPGGGGGYNQGGGHQGNQNYNPGGGGGGWGNGGYGGGGGGGGWGQPQGQQQQQQQQPGQDQAKSNEAAWQAFYQQQQQYYQQQQPGQAMQPQAAATSTPQSATGSQPTATQSQGQTQTQAGQPDYSSQWAEYYRQQEAMRAQGGTQQGGAQPDYSAAWAEYFRQQQAMYASQQGQQGQAPPAGQPGQQPNQQATGYPQ